MSEVEKGEAVGEALRGHIKWVECVVWSAGGTRLASGSRYETMPVWEIETGECGKMVLAGTIGIVLDSIYY